MSCFIREICTTPEWITLRREEHGQWPATLLTKHMESLHIDLVNVRALFAVYLDVDEMLIHESGCCFILKTFMGHNVAPMTGGVANRQQNWLVCFLRFFQCFLTPLPPVDRVILVLKKVRA